MKFQSFLKEIKKQRGKRKRDELSNPARKKIRVQNLSQIQVPSSPPPSPSSLTSSLSLSSAPSSSSHNWTHDVFPSFRGEDVRIGFLSHIQKEFKRKGITPFIDNEIRRGESIGPELIRAIRGSKIAIILLSRNYASSKWCLDELVEIMKCKEELGQTVIPVFYKVDPSDVKKLRGYFGKVFEKTCEGKSKEDTEKWRQALEKVATIAGYDSSTWDNEAAMIEQIATDVSNKLISSVPSSDFDSLVGMRAHMKSMELLLRLDSDEVRMIGIWGPSGIGKSTIARSLFSQHSPDFQLSVFMENIKREYPRPCFDRYSAQLQLQNKFLSLILNQNDVAIHHLGVAQDRLKNKKVLVVLDDVDHSAQLDALAKETCWFGSGSRIIVTTQDIRILNAHRINLIYKVDFPRDDEALEIFCINAFGQKSPYDGFGDLAREVTRLASKLPLGLSVMGSYFKGLSKEMWERELPRLRTRLDGETESILKFSYDALCDEDQALFLHIACFFNGERTDKVEEFLAEKFVGVEGRLRVLAEKSLISVDSKEYIRMHDLLARLGREIVRKQSPNEPGQRQFLVDDGDIRQVLRDDTLGSRSVIGINFLLEKELKISDQAFERMSNLQFLRLDSHYFDHVLLRRTNSQYILESVNCLPREVRLLDWSTFPMTCLPSNFNPELLMEIKMRCSNLEKLWEGNKTIRNLKWMDLYNSKNLKELPNLSTATNLRELNLFGCSSLMELPSSIGNLTNLKKLNLTLCLSLMEVPSSISNMTNLKELELNGCLSLVELTFGNMTNLKNLYLSGCSSLVEISSSIGNMTNLVKLDLSGCSSLEELPSSIGNMTNLENLNLSGCSKLKALPININMKSLDELDLTYCSSMKRFPEISTNISVLKIDGTAIKEIPASISSWSRLDRLHVSYSENLGRSRHVFDRIRKLDLNDTGLQEIAPWVKEMSCLETLVIHGCSNLQKLRSSIGNLTNLENLDLKGCSSLVELPSSIGNMTNLENLDLKGCSSLMELPSSIGNMTNLETLNLDGCSSLVELPSSIGNLHNLKRLNLGNCSKLMSLPVNINMKSLDELDLSYCSVLKSFPEISTNIRVLKLNGTAIEEIPTSIRSWSRLERLDMSYSENLRKSHHAFDLITNLHLSDTGIQEISPLVKEMSRLRELVINGCTKLVSLPQLPHSLEFMHVENCESLERLDCSFYRTKFTDLCFVNCLKLNREAVDLILKTSTKGWVIFPGETVPAYFSYRATGSSVSMKLNGFDTRFPTSFRFKACLLLVTKPGDVESAAWYRSDIFYCINGKLRDVGIFQRYANILDPLCPRFEHLVVFEFEETVTSPESVFEFRFKKKNWGIKECGLRPLKSLALSW
ncbi:probable disease resistance protein RPP1 [Brassica napus]|uniref:probable disease resistance protein RPP1 n=1 Tax=Brassica napus TaxID=3708 RepID=UPI0020787CD1|nr:probable disease resistance protein RPP1 [Brassica napus]